MAVGCARRSARRCVPAPTNQSNEQQSNSTGSQNSKCRAVYIPSTHILPRIVLWSDWATDCSVLIPQRDEKWQHSSAEPFVGISTPSSASAASAALAAGLLVGIRWSCRMEMRGRWVTRRMQRQVAAAVATRLVPLRSSTGTHYIYYACVDRCPAAPRAHAGAARARARIHYA